MQSATFYLEMMGETAEKPLNPLECALRDLTEPDPRMAEAVALMFASVDCLGTADLQAFNVAALRRVGYLLERFGEASPSVLEDLMSHVGNVDEPVFFTPFVSRTRSERLLQMADAVQTKWGVYGDLELRTA